MGARDTRLRALAAVLLLVGCRDQVFEPVRDGLAASALLSGRVRVVTKADLLFVVDDSRSMQNELDKVAQGFPALATALDALDPPISWRVAVMTTSVDERFGPCDLGDPAAPAACSASFGGAGFACEEGQCVRRFPSLAGQLIGSPPSLDRDAMSAAALTQAFAQRVRVDLDGSRQEQPLRALRLAVSEGGLAGFRRDDARLVVFVVSDEDDCSDSTGRTMALERTASGEIDHCASDAGLDDLDEWDRWFRAQGDVALGGVVGLAPGTGSAGQCVDAACVAACGAASGQLACQQQCAGALLPARCVGECIAQCESFCGSQAPGRRLAMAVRAASGPLSSVCESDYGPPLAHLARVLGIPTSLALPSRPADPRALFFQVTRRGQLIDCRQGPDWRLDATVDPPLLVIEQAGACRLQPDDAWEVRYLAQTPPSP